MNPAIFSVQGHTIVLGHVSTISDISQIGMLFVWTVSCGAYATTFRHKEIEDARATRKEFVEALSAFLQK